MTEFFNIVLAGSAFNTLYKFYCEKDSYGKLTDQVMEAFTGFVRTLLACYGHIIVLCSNYPFLWLYQLFTAVKEKNNEANTLDKKIEKLLDRFVLTIDRKPLKLVRTNGYYNCYPGNECLNRINMVQQAVHL